MGWLSHLEELRTRLLYMLATVAIGMVVGWFIYPYAYHLLATPIITMIKAHHGQVITLHPAEMFFYQVKLSAILGVILASPVIIWQLWAFIRPGLHPHERRVVAPIVPMISVLFLAGAAMAYQVMPQVMVFFLSFTPEGVSPFMDFEHSINLPLQVMLAFGLAFQLPIVLLGLVMLGMLSANTLLQQWKVAMVVLGVIAAVITPTGDPLNWSIMMAPLVILYFGTIVIAIRLEKRRAAADAAGQDAET